MATPQRRLSVIVCADVVGFNRLIGDDETATRAAFAAHRAAIEPIFAAEGGRVVNPTDGGLLLEFASALQAVRAALDVQRLMAEHNVGVPPHRQLIFAIGIDLGDVIVVDDDVSGDAVDIARRLQEIADPGGVCLSQPVYATIQRAVDVPFRDGGAKVLKNDATPIQVYNLVLDGYMPAEPAYRGSVTQTPMTPSAGPLLSLVVLPFLNLSGDTRQDSLVEHITDQLTRELARIENSYIVAPNAALAYGEGAQEIGHQLAVRYAIKGSVHAADGGLRVNAQLMDAESGRTLWIDRFDIALGDPFAMRNDAVARLVPPLHAHLFAASGRAPLPAPTPLTQAAQPDWGAPAEMQPYDRAPDLVAPISAVAPPPGAVPASRGPRTPPVVRLAAPPAPAGGRFMLPAAPPHPRVSLLWRVAVGVLIILLVGVIALMLLGPQRGSIVEVVSWMLLTAGIVVMIDAIGSGPRPAE